MNVKSAKLWYYGIHGLKHGLAWAACSYLIRGVYLIGFYGSPEYIWDVENSVAVIVTALVLLISGIIILSSGIIPTFEFVRDKYQDAKYLVEDERHRKPKEF